MIPTASRSWPSTSPMITPTRFLSSLITSYQSPPTSAPAVAGRYRAVASTPLTYGKSRRQQGTLHAPADFLLYLVATCPLQRLRHLAEHGREGCEILISQ